ncbi:MAG: FHA domain-containing protein, partial [Anaerolineae bacterium]|nr:FHA domain-containing protein [Anaerolineae bacterium]
MAEASERQNQPRLIVEDTGQVFVLGQDLVTIGRKSGNTIVLGNDLKTSRHHATIAWDDEKDAYIVYDVG